MKPFHFNLEKVLQLRQRKRDQLREELAMAMHALRILEDQKEGLAGQFAQHRRERTAEAARSEVRVDHLLEGQRYELMLAAQQKQLAAQIEQVGEELERRRLTLVEADRDVQVMEKLKEKRFEEYERDRLRSESKEMDELASRIMQNRKGARL